MASLACAWRKRRLCRWHEGEEPIEEEDTPQGCPECSRLLTTRICRGCGQEFLDWEWTEPDDVVGSPCATSTGDLACSGCIGHFEARVEREEEDEYCGWEDYYDFEDLEDVQETDEED